MLDSVQVKYPGSIENFTSKEIDFLESYYTILTRHKSFPDLSVSLIDCIVNLTLDFLYDLSEYSGKFREIINFTTVVKLHRVLRHLT